MKVHLNTGAVTFWFDCKIYQLLSVLTCMPVNCMHSARNVTLNAQQNHVWMSLRVPCTPNGVREILWAPYENIALMSSKESYRNYWSKHIQSRTCTNTLMPSQGWLNRGLLGIIGLRRIAELKAYCSVQRYCTPSVLHEQPLTRWSSRSCHCWSVNQLHGSWVAKDLHYSQQAIIPHLVCVVHLQRGHWKVSHTLCGDFETSCSVCVASSLA